jgi:hypothetical protein
VFLLLIIIIIICTSLTDLLRVMCRGSSSRWSCDCYCCLLFLRDKTAKPRFLVASRKNYVQIAVIFECFEILWTKKFEEKCDEWILSKMFLRIPATGWHDENESQLSRVPHASREKEIINNTLGAGETVLGMSARPPQCQRHSMPIKNQWKTHINPSTTEAGQLTHHHHHHHHHYFFDSTTCTTNKVVLLYLLLPTIHTVWSSCDHQYTLFFPTVFCFVCWITQLLLTKWN